MVIDSRRAALFGILDRGIARGEPASETDRGLVADVIYGPMWYRLLNRHAPLNSRFATDLVAIVMAAARSESR